MITKTVLASFTKEVKFKETTELLNDLFSNKVFNSIFVSSDLKTSEEQDHLSIKDLVLSNKFTKVDNEVLQNYVTTHSTFYDKFVTYNNDKTITLVLPYNRIYHTNNLIIEYFENTLIFIFYKDNEVDFDFVYAIKFV